MQALLPDLPCYLNGTYGPLAEAKVSPMDRGFIFGDGAYELLPVYAGRIFRFDEHMDRFERSLAKLRIISPLLRAQWLEIARRLAEEARSKSGAEDQWVYLQVTRGVAAQRNHVMPEDCTPTVFAYSAPARWVAESERHQGAACVTARDFRWERGDIKSISLLGNVLARQISADQDALETILLRDGFLTEASASNVWIVKEDALLGPPKSEQVLEGIRVELLHELCEECGIGYNLRPISEAELFAADEIILSSATKEVLAVTTLDKEPVGHGALRGKPGPVYARLYEAYQRAKHLQSI
ncbi:aminotransferase class IV [Roseateles violae]|uniref:Aminotransferase class IV n=1 Tax=Roseateles violae TaxID=3058042 RepID=A0ABT8DQU3_9BURK|nr:aminotransferase class IV [Pelomonas sp. PFR6]MDN3918662.1 aminotransferase class IV [Pelomonas sp. PFR6]